MRRLKLLKKTIISQLEPEKFYTKLLGSEHIKWNLGTEWAEVYCPFHNPLWKEKKGKSPSLSVNRDGQFRCHSPSCGIHGSNVVNFYENFKQLPFKKTLRELYRKYVRPTVPLKLVEEWHATLLDSPNVLRYITEGRGLDRKTVVKHQLGFDGTRITIPVFDAFGFVVDVRRYDFTKKMKRKILSYKEGYGGAKFYPIENLLGPHDGRILLCEGEWDCLVANERGYRAVTVTSSAGSWPPDPDADKLFKDKRVRIVFDVNDVKSDGTPSNAGQIGAEKVAERLASIARDVKVVKLPLENSGGDISDWFVKEGRSKTELDEVIHSTPYFSERSSTGPKGDRTYKLIRLDEAGKAEHYYTPIEMDCLVAGKDLSPFMPPAKVRVTATDKESGDEETYDLKVPIEGNKELLKLISVPDAAMKGSLESILGLSAGSSYKFETLETFNVEELRLIPAIDLADLAGAYVVRRAFYLGHGLESNRTYRMRGFTIPDPKTQSAVHVITEAVPIHDNIENFELTPKVRADLEKKFKPGGTVKEQIEKISDWLSRNVTKIKRRTDLHVAIDLVFHSVLSFRFNEEEVHKGWLELLVIGDTRCGKGYVAERLSKFYRMGEVVTGENCTFAGLVGGLQQMDKRWIITWGKVVLNDKRLVVIDEVSAMDTRDIGRMSRVRSEGIAEIIKIQSEKARARTRMIWLSNARSGRPINTYNNGVEAILELMGTVEDVSRFDFAMTVASAEVPSKVINAPAKDQGDSDAYDAKSFSNLILWAWSRKPEQILFTKRATTAILETSVRMGRIYSPAIPLVQGENIRVKLAKISVAVAARCFSSDEEGESLVVKSEHVEFAADLLTQLYSKPSMGYDAFSSTDIDRSSIKSEEAVTKVVQDLGRYSLDFIDGILEHKELSYSDVIDFTGADILEARETISKLVRLRCLTKNGEKYTKKPAFINLLRSLRDRIRKG